MSIFPLKSSHPSSDEHLVAFLKEHQMEVPPSRPDFEDALMAQIMAMPSPENITDRHSASLPSSANYRFGNQLKKWWVAIPLAIVCLSGAGALWFRPSTPQFSVAEEEAIEKTLIASWSFTHGAEVSDLGEPINDSQGISNNELDLEAALQPIYESSEPE
ncbi:MAG: hypothetical protein WCO45_05170 [Pseudanabaena sp. ELA607]|jgi:hypothetical protein